MSFSVTEYGRRELLLSAVVASAALAAVAAVSAVFSAWFIPLAAVPLAAWAAVVWFFRDPDREPPSEAGVFVSPADGVVADITPVGADSLLGRKGLRIGVFMSVLNVHVNRSPCDGLVEKIGHRSGSFLDVRKPLAPERNESTAIRLIHRYAGRDWPVIIRQVAGLVARRIVTDLSEGREVARGRRIGMIKFGSRLELWLPAELAGEVRVRPGDPVRAGESVLVAATPAAGKESDGSIAPT